MSDQPADPMARDSAESELRAALARGDAVAGAALPVLRQLLASDRATLFGDGIMARLRGMLAGLAGELHAELTGPTAATDDADTTADTVAALAAVLSEVPGLLSHLHALAVEFHHTERVAARMGADPVLSPLLQALIASSDPATAAAAMKLLAAQARFIAAQRRMQLPLAELPGELLHDVLVALHTHAGEQAIVLAQAIAAEAAIRARYDEAATRLGLLNRMIAVMGNGAVAALSVGHGGIAIFLTALAMALGTGRESTALMLDDGQLVRLALALRGLGLKSAQVAEIALTLHPDAATPDVARVHPERALALLSGDVSDAIGPLR